MLRLPRLFSDGCVLQQGDRCRIWGWCDPGETLCIVIGTDMGAGAKEMETVSRRAQTEADESGRFEAGLQTPPAGGPYLMRVETSRGEEAVIREVYVGEVFVCSGQSNMELPMSRVCERFPEEFRDGGAPDVHEYKVTECRDFRSPLEDHVQAEWRACTGKKLPEISAFVYFFGKELARVKKVPIGILNLSLGGTPAEAWMSREGLREWPEALEEADCYMDEEFCRKLGGQEMRAEVNWQREISRQEKESADAPWRPAVLPGEVRDWGLENFCGGIHLRRTFSVPSDCLQREGLLRFGTLVDSDTIYINGTRIGETGYRYPPRRYPVPAGLLHEGENEILIRLVCRTGEGRSTAGQPLEIVWESESSAREARADDAAGSAQETRADDAAGSAQETRADDAAGSAQETWADGADASAGIDPTDRLVRMALAEREGRLARVSLAGAWEYQQRAVCGEAPGQTFISWKPTGLFHGMTAPCLPYQVRGALWYQGESNDSRPQTYNAVLEGLIRDWRKHWRQESLPFVVMQLPNCGVDVAPDDAWPQIREAQALAGRLEDVAVTVNLDAGEDNDLHPRDKKTVATRAAYAVRAMIYKEKTEWSAPKVCGWELAPRGRKTTPDGCVRLRFDSRVGLRLRPAMQDVPDNPRLFELAGEDGVYYPALVRVEDDVENSTENDAGNRAENSIENSVENGIENSTENGAGNRAENSMGNDTQGAAVSAACSSGTCVILHSENVPCPRYVRYAWFRAPGPLLLYGENGFCVGPFRLHLEREQEERKQ